MLSQLPERADPRRLCEQGKNFAGRLALREFPRLLPLLASDEGEAAFTLDFGLDGQKRPRITGSVIAKLVVTCQRCIGPMDLDVDADFVLSPVMGSQEAERLPDDYDPLMLEQPMLAPVDLIEDELILAIPPAPRHEPSQCAMQLAEYQVGESEITDEANEKENPFGVLARLRRDTNDK